MYWADYDNLRLIFIGTLKYVCYDLLNHID